MNPGAFDRVYKRLRVVLTCIVEDKGGNTLVEERRGKLFRDATIPENEFQDEQSVSQQPTILHLDIDESDDDNVLDD